MNFTNLSIAEMLRQGFQYDLWATMRWYNAVQLMKNQEQASPVLQHILTSQRNWLERCGVPIDGFSRVANKVSFEASSAAWQLLITSKPLDTKYDYSDRRGRPHQRELGEIGWHVINHGTFHRGHLRGLAQAENIEEFADTDLLDFFDEQRVRG